MAEVILTSWQKTEAPTAPSPGSVHLWRFSLHDKSFPEVLSDDEKQRAQRLRVPEKAKAFIVARTRLRQILGLYLNIPPEDIAFDYNEHGKPLLPSEFSGELNFNLSHSGNRGLCAVRKGGDVGIDLEVVKQELDVVPLAERFFTTAEKDWVLASNACRLRRNFYRLWTRKEAWLKGKGGGFSELSLGLADEHIMGCSSRADGWTLMNLTVAQGYVGALAVKGEVDRVERFYFSG